MRTAKLRAATLTIAFVSVADASIVAADPLSGDQVRTLVAGKTLALAAPFGSLPIRYSAGGTMIARSTAMGLYAGVSEDRGTWRIDGNRLCQTWTIWKGAKEQCFSLSRTGSTVRWTSTDGMTGTAYARN